MLHILSLNLTFGVVVRGMQKKPPPTTPKVLQEYFLSPKSPVEFTDVCGVFKNVCCKSNKV